MLRRQNMNYSHPQAPSLSQFAFAPSKESIRTEFRPVPFKEQAFFSSRQWLEGNDLAVVVFPAVFFGVLFPSAFFHPVP